MYPIVFYLYNRIKPAVFSLILFWAFIRFVYSNPFTSFNRGWSETEVIRSMVHNPKGCYKKTTKTLFFKHLYLICTLFYNTLSFSYVIHSTYVPYFRLQQTPKKEKKKPSITSVSFLGLTITDWVLLLLHSDSNRCLNFQLSSIGSYWAWIRTFLR